MGECYIICSYYNKIIFEIKNGQLQIYITQSASEKGSHDFVYIICPISLGNGILPVVLPSKSLIHSQTMSIQSIITGLLKCYAVAVK